jgi:hypothetical protein
MKDTRGKAKLAGTVTIACLKIAGSTCSPVEHFRAPGFHVPITNARVSVMKRVGSRAILGVGASSRGACGAHGIHVIRTLEVPYNRTANAVARQLSNEFVKIVNTPTYVYCPYSVVILLIYGLEWILLVTLCPFHPRAASTPVFAKNPVLSSPGPGHFQRMTQAAHPKHSSAQAELVFCGTAGMHV